jgi:5-methylcytosine-specific restriction endonuclease McrA
VNRPPFSKILVLDQGGTPKSWIDRQKAIEYAATNSVAWIPPTAETDIVFGGTNSHTGQTSTLEIASIVAIKGPMAAQLNGYKTPKVSNKALFARDHHRCAYCGNYFDTEALTKDHINPKAKGGKNTWMNLITSCKPCNARKADRTPERAGMTLRYKPYNPTPIEYLWLRNRSMTDEQIKYLEDFDTRGRRKDKQ